MHRARSLRLWRRRIAGTCEIVFQFDEQPKGFWRGAQRRKDFIQGWNAQTVLPNDLRMIAGIRAGRIGAADIEVFEFG